MNKKGRRCMDDWKKIGEWLNLCIWFVLIFISGLTIHIFSKWDFIYFVFVDIIYTIAFTVVKYALDLCLVCFIKYDGNRIFSIFYRFFLNNQTRYLSLTETNSPCFYLIKVRLWEVLFYLFLNIFNSVYFSICHL